METTNESQSKKKNITLGLIVGWVLGVGSLLAGVTFLSSNLLAGCLYIVAAIILIPPACNFAQEKLHVSLSRGVKVISVLVIFFIIGTMLNGSKISKVEVPVVADSKPQDTPQNAKTPEPPVETVMKVSAAKIISDYKANEVAADTLYKER